MADGTPRNVPARGSPLAALALPAGSRGSVRLEEAAPRALINLRCDPDRQASLQAVAPLVPSALPGEANRWHGDARRYAAWLGPDEWLIAAADGSGPDLERRLADALRDDPRAGICDVSHSYTGLVLAGPEARTVLAKGCPLDLHAASFQIGHCAQSVLAATRVLILCGAAEDRFELWVRNSFARYTAAWLKDAMAEFHR